MLSLLHLSLVCCSCRSGAQDSILPCSIARVFAHTLQAGRVPEVQPDRTTSNPERPASALNRSFPKLKVPNPGLKRNSGVGIYHRCKDNPFLRPGNSATNKTPGCQRPKASKPEAVEHDGRSSKSCSSVSTLSCCCTGIGFCSKACSV